MRHERGELLEQVLDFVLVQTLEKIEGDRKELPSLSEIEKGLGYSHDSAYPIRKTVKSLESKEYVERLGTRYRTTGSGVKFLFESVKSSGRAKSLEFFRTFYEKRLKSAGRLEESKLVITPDGKIQSEPSPSPWPWTTVYGDLLEIGANVRDVVEGKEQKPELSYSFRSDELVPRPGELFEFPERIQDQINADLQRLVAPRRALLSVTVKVVKFLDDNGR